MDDTLREAALEYYRSPRPGKISIVPTKALVNQRDLPLAYSPGVAAACEEIVRDPAEAANLTARASLLVTPTLEAANIAFNLLKIAAGDGITVGPILLGAAAPVHILTPSAAVRRLVNMAALTVVEANLERHTAARP